MDFLPPGIILPLLGVPALKISTLPELFSTPSELEPPYVLSPILVTLTAALSLVAKIVSGEASESTRFGGCH